MKLITCVCLFVTLLSASDAFLDLGAMFQNIAAQQAAINQRVRDSMNNANRQMQQNFAMTSGGGSVSSTSMGSMSNQQSTTCVNNRCTICINGQCTVCEGSDCSSFGVGF